MYTEFTSAEGLCLSSGRLLRDLLYDESQRPIIAQIFGKRPHFFYQAAIIVGAPFYESEQLESQM